jgi:hypothetical protein
VSDEPAERRRRGSVALYVVAFALLLAAGIAVALSVASFFETLTLMWVSVWCSAGAIVVAVLAVVWPRRR